MKSIEHELNISEMCFILLRFRGNSENQSFLTERERGGANSPDEGPALEAALL